MAATVEPVKLSAKSFAWWLCKSTGNKFINKYLVVEGRLWVLAIDQLHS